KFIKLVILVEIKVLLMLKIHILDGYLRDRKLLHVNLLAGFFGAFLVFALGKAISKNGQKRAEMVILCLQG
ncbi:MAG: hypothetical protein NZ932_07095, partial [Candidatus Bathyarchaeota archaeon]|nr:hypothetical protein [Candidatus Bathyarchaeota archaeon]